MKYTIFVNTALASMLGLWSVGVLGWNNNVTSPTSANDKRINNRCPKQRDCQVDSLLYSDCGNSSSIEDVILYKFGVEDTNNVGAIRMRFSDSIEVENISMIISRNHPSTNCFLFCEGFVIGPKGEYSIWLNYKVNEEARSFNGEISIEKNTITDIVFEPNLSTTKLIFNNGGKISDYVNVDWDKPIRDSLSMHRLLEVYGDR